MGYTADVIDKFGGLNLVDDPLKVGPEQAIDMMNVDVDRYGRLRSRDGYAKRTASAGTNRYDSLAAFYNTSGVRNIVAGAGTRLEAFDSTGNLQGSATGLTGGPWSFARIGTPNNEYIYCGNGADTLRRWDGTAWAAPTATVDGVTGKFMPKPRCLAAWQNRLVAAGFLGSTAGPNGGASSKSHVYFSTPGNAESWLSNDFVQLTPGDGEQIMGVIVWRELLFVFKESRFFVFYGSHADGTGNAVFDYRVVDSTAGLQSQRALTSSGDGVYFLGRNAIYFTTGGPPQDISTSTIGPLLSARTVSPYSGPYLNGTLLTSSAMCWHRGRLYFAFPQLTLNTNTHMLVWDPHIGWILWNIPAAALLSYQYADRNHLYFAYPTGTKDIGYLVEDGFTTDDGAVIPSLYRSGYYDFGKTSDSVIRESIVWGSGSVAVQRVNEGVVGTGQTLTLGTAPAIDQAHYRDSAQAHYHGHQLSSSVPWLMSRLIHNVRDERPPGSN